MARILVLEKDASRFAALQALAARAGYEAVQVDSLRRLTLESRAADAAVVVASAEMNKGTGLELVRDGYGELAEALPVVAFSSHLTPSEVLDRAPVDILLVAIVAPAASPRRVLQAVLAAAPPADPEAARAALAEDSAGDAQDDVGMHIGGSVPLRSGTAERLLVAIDQQHWTGAAHYRPGTSDPVAITAQFVSGELAEIHSGESGDLIATAREQGRLEGITLPDVALSSADEEVGLLMAMRALGTHEVEQLRASNDSRLVGVLLDAQQGALSFEEGPQALPPDPRPRTLLPILLTRIGARGGEVRADGMPDSELTVTLPKQRSYRALGSLDREVLQQLKACGQRPTLLGGFLDQFGAAASDRRTHAQACLSQLRQLGYVDYRCALFPEMVSIELREMVTQMHSWSRANHFEVLGVGSDVSDSSVRDRMRKLSLIYHPDRRLGAHPRVQSLAVLMYAHVQEVFTKVETTPARSEYRALLRSEESEETATGKDQDSARVAMAQASILVRRKRYADAAALYRDATLHNSVNAEAHMWLGWCTYLGDSTQIAAAQAEMQRALEIKPRLVDAVFYLGRIQLLEENYEEARGYFEKAAEAPAGHSRATSELRLMDSRGLGLSAQEQAERAAEAEEKGTGKGLFSRFRRG
jgi:tetratricopeptide (TPR) repeat protein